VIEFEKEATFFLFWFGGVVVGTVLCDKVVLISREHWVLRV